MAISVRDFLVLSIGLLFCTLGCTRDEIHETDHAEVSFEESILPILMSRCALAGCHVANGPHGLDFRTYESFIAGGEHGPAFIPGHAEESEIVEEIVEGKMPPPESGIPTLSATELQTLKDWINQQEAQDHVVPHEHNDHDHEE